MRPFLIALQFLTRLPVRLTLSPAPSEIGHSLLYYPLIGLLLGAMLSGISWLLSGVAVPLSSALLLFFWVIMTGALHLDGLADSMDAWVGGLGDRDRTLSIMKDPYCGPMGVTAVVLILLIKYGAICGLSIIGNNYLLLIAPLLGRAVLPLLFITTPYVRPSGLGAALASQVPRKAAIGVIMLCLASNLIAGVAGLCSLLGTIGIFLIARLMMMRRIGGTTGDTAGALVELTEATVLVCAVITHSFSWTSMQTS